MAEAQKQGFQRSFNRFLRVASQGSRVLSSWGLFLAWEWYDRPGFAELVEEHRTDSRANKHGFLLWICCGNRCTAAWLDTRM